ncbi:nucleotide disphospho-sugar-binding domain-containing protein [Streptomyces sp. NPDC006193]|uniref:nucleotide disphospho-sugar-binding domain-containing protein n=1 Tax=Streptomyces sp. NPDC006193 TaxID=3155717 RepID=UPI00339DD206
MRVLFTTSEWPGHYFCMVPLGWALQAAGHEVAVTCKPSQREAVGRAGLTAVAVADGPDLAVLTRVVHHIEISMGVREPRGPLLNPFTGRPMGEPGEPDVAVEGPRFLRQAAEATRRGCDNVVEFARRWRPDLVVHDVMATEGALAALVVSVPSVLCAPGLFGTVETEKALDLSPGDPVEHFERYGVGPWGRDRIRYVIDPSPSGAVPPLAGALRLPVRYVPYNGPAASAPGSVPRREGPRVCILWGNSATRLFGPDLPALGYAVEAAASCAFDVVLTAGSEQIDALGPLPPRVHTLRGHPLHLLLDGSDLLIDHGSDNPVMNAAVAGVPRVGLALSDDHFAYGRRIDPLGASRTLPGLTARREEVHGAVEEVLTGPAYRAAAAGLRADLLARPAPARLVPALERLAANGSLGAQEVPHAEPVAQR